MAVGSNADLDSYYCTCEMFPMKIENDVSGFLIVFDSSLQDTVTRPPCPMAERPSASCTRRLVSPSPSSSSPLPCKGSWCSARGGRSPTSTGTGACRRQWWAWSTPWCSAVWPSASSSSSQLPSSRRWRTTGTSWIPSTSASSRSAQSASEITSPERQRIRSTGSCIKWASLVSYDKTFIFFFSGQNYEN